MRAEITVTGIVQGVGFRPFIYRLAVSHGLVGFVQNRGDATVLIVVEGDEDSIRRFIREIREKKPPLAKIFSLETAFTDSRGEFSRFEIRKSSSRRSRRASIIPPDVSICDDCIREMRDPSDRRYSYFFITCTNCGPRFTAIEKLPYDRPNTTMIDFPMCSRCREEYENPLDRRFHAQTIACPACGPRVYLTDRSGEEIDVKDPVREVGKLIDEGHVIAVKGIGGFHMATATTDSEPILRLRAVKHRRRKPFAIMARDLDAVKTFAEVTPLEEKMLKSYMRPIVLLKKSESYYLSDQISPGLHTVGVMLPYTGMHIMMFDWSREPAFVMTSANPPDEPIIKDNSEAIRKLGGIADYFLLHNRRIAQRCDDSVLRVVAESTALIRRSRGYAPAPIELKRELNTEVLALGGEKRVTSCILTGKRCFASQHIGDVERLETLRYLEEATIHLLRLVGAEPSVIACDLHPAFHTTRLARRIAEELGAPVEKVQHHHAHIASLMAEKGLDELVGLSCDGYGYGPGGEAWGGEILYCNREGYKRLGHLEQHVMPGGDLATRYPARMTASILYRLGVAEEWLEENSKTLPHGEREVEVVVKQIKRKAGPLTSSCGRVLDAVSALLGICYERTYEGEPAMKLEAFAAQGKDTLRLQPEIRGGVLLTTSLFAELYSRLGREKPADLACSAQAYIARGLAELAIDAALDMGVKAVGFSGGVAYNEAIVMEVKRTVEKAGLKLLVHSEIPPGDAGISVGQAYYTAFKWS